LQEVLSNQRFADYDLDFSNFSKVLFFDFYNDVRDDPNDKGDLYDLIEQFKQKIDYDRQKASLAVEPQKTNLDTHSLQRIMGELRAIKQPVEIELLKYGAEYEGYPSIVGAGNNGCVLHYIENSKPAIADGELVLMDLGAEYWQVQQGAKGHLRTGAQSPTGGY